MASWVVISILTLGALFGADATAADYGDFSDHGAWDAGSYEPYSVRPDIGSVRRLSHSEGLPASWSRVKYAQLELVAQTMEMYPDRQVYFLGRDLEWGNDAWTGLNSGSPSERERSHLLNVSQDTKESPHLEKYLASRGLDRRSIHLGKKAVFLDTGYYGSIPQALSEVFTSAAPKQLVTQLMVSGNSDVPSSRSSLFYLDPRAADTKPSLLHSSIRDFEDLPHYTEKAEFYQNLHGNWEAMSPTHGDPESSKIYMEDLAGFLDDPKVRAYFATRRKFWRELKQLEIQGDRPAAIATLRRLLAEDPANGQMRAAVRDFLEIVRLNSDAHLPLIITPGDVGLSPESITRLPAAVDCLSPKIHLMLHGQQ